MSYTSITGMRSNRYPLMGRGDGLGCGCGCGGNGGCGSMGQDNGTTREIVGSALGIAAVGATVLGVLWFMGNDVKANRRRSRRRRRRRRTSRRR